MVNFKIKWHAQYAVYPLASEHVLFLSELDQFILSAIDFSSINTVVEKQGKLSDYLFDQDDIRTQFDKLERIDQFVADGILVNPQQQHAPQFVTPNFSMDFDQVTIGGRQIYNLSFATSHDAVQAIATAVELPDNVSLALVDDYLDPRLPELSKQFSSEARNWLLIKPSGQINMVGPLFTYNDNDKACYQCLCDRLKQNNPVRIWLARIQPFTELPPFPVLINKKCIEHIQIMLKRGQFTGAESCMYSHAWHAETPNYPAKCHSIKKRPQCNACGDPQSFVKDNHGSVELNECMRDLDSDGGYRVVTRKAFLENTRDLIDAKIGIIAELEEITDSRQTLGMSIYRASYYQTTHSEDNITADTFIQQSLGKGVSTAQSMSSAVGEALERQAAQYVGDEGFIYATVTQLKHAAYIPQELSSFSDKQYEQFASFSGVSRQNPQWVEKFQSEYPMHWIIGWSLTCKKPVYFPAAFCLANTPFTDSKYSSYTHNGNACGSTKEEAILQGLLELIERDAVAVWWYNQIPRPQLSLDIIGSAERKKIDRALSEQWQYWLLDVTNNINIVTCVAVGQHKHTNKFVLGFGTHINPSIAAQRALTEMYQLITIKDRVSGPFDFDCIANKPFMFPKRQTRPKTINDYNVNDSGMSDSSNIKDSIDIIVERAGQLGLDVCIVNYTRADIPASTLKVIIPGLAHFWPQFSNTRLYQVPVELGWLSNSLEEDDFNGQALYV